MATIDGFVGYLQIKIIFSTSVLYLYINSAYAF